MKASLTEYRQAKKDYRQFHDSLNLNYADDSIRFDADREKATAKLFKQIVQQKMLQGPLPNKKAAWLYPFAQERAYQKQLKKILNKFTAITISAIKPNLSRWLSEFNDSASDDLENINPQFERQKEILLNTFLFELKDILLALGITVSLFNKKQWQKILKASLDIEFLIQESWEKPLLNAWVNRNVGLIKGLLDDYTKQINDAVQQGFLEGVTANKLAQTLRKINRNFSQYRTMLIARDQINKLNGAFARRRQLDAGVDKYTWNTSIDERVRGRPGGKYPNARPTHWALEGKLCRWDNSTLYSVDGGKTWLQRSSLGAVQVPPGFAILCRCWGNPYFEEIINEIEEEK